MKTAFAAMRLGILAYIMPFLFVFSPALILTGTMVQIALAVSSALVGTLFLGVAISGYLFRTMRWPKRLVAFAISVSFFYPLLSHSSLEWISYLVGTGLAIAFLTSELRKRAVLATRGSHD